MVQSTSVFGHLNTREGHLNTRPWAGRGSRVAVLAQEVIRAGHSCVLPHHNPFPCPRAPHLDLALHPPCHAGDMRPCTSPSSQSSGVFYGANVNGIGNRRESPYLGRGCKRSRSKRRPGDDMTSNWLSASLRLHWIILVWSRARTLACPSLTVLPSKVQRRQENCQRTHGACMGRPKWAIWHAEQLRTALRGSLEPHCLGL